MKRVELELTSSLRLEFTDRDRALRQVEKWAEKSTRWPVVIFGPEGRGKTAFLRQATYMLKETGYNVFHLHPLDRVFTVEVDEPDIKSVFLDIARQSIADEEWGRIAMALFDLVRELLKSRKRKIAIIADDVFQAIGLDKAAAYVKGLLNMIEHPQYEYEKIVVLVATSEGVTRGEIGRHRWAEITPMWNMPKEGFQQLYDKIPGPKPPFEEVWRLTGGNPGMLAKLYETEWDVEKVVLRLVREKELVSAFIERWRRWLELAVDDPDVLWSPEAPEELVDELVSRNLVVYNMYDRDEYFWIDQPPPEKDLEIGVGKNVAWQKPIHREAIRKALRRQMP